MTNYSKVREQRDVEKAKREEAEKGKRHAEALLRECGDQRAKLQQEVDSLRTRLVYRVAIRACQFSNLTFAEAQRQHALLEPTFGKFVTIERM